MLERIRVTNFQRLASLKVKPGEQITVVVGPTDAGKSSLCRAIRWLALNRPRGSGFIRWGQKSCSVKVRIGGHDIERVKDSKGNRYVLDGEEYKAIGTDVPPAVAKALALGPENFAQQHDAPFWFDLTAGELGKELNKIVDMDIIDRAAAEVSSRLRKGRSTEDVCEQRLVQAEEQAKKLEWVPGFVGELEELTGLEDTVERIRGDLSDLEESLVEMRGYEEEIENNRGFAEAGQEVLKKGVVFKQTKQRWGLLRGLLDEIEEKTRDVADFRYNRDGERERLEEESEGRCPICGGTLK